MQNSMKNKHIDESEMTGINSKSPDTTTASPATPTPNQTRTSAAISGTDSQILPQPTMLNLPSDYASTTSARHNYTITEPPIVESDQETQV